MQDRSGERAAADRKIVDLLAKLKLRLEQRLGDRFVALYLFGSRARGDHQPDSDVDVAVVLNQAIPRPFQAKCELLDDTYPLMLETGYYVQPWPLEEGALERPDAHPSPEISRAVRREGRRV